ncbi:MAG TPA: hypothetical protein VE944_13415 [Nostoc sp.]|uniref:hypothetical protein n=1 Tax=Nostoc sp. TaxID=1180 RepID=UPI002D393041|nr:hypothetical protein [Nostoc sp.]HYX15338.1 hypothetical protein [Nostoc sp.]
MTQTEAELEQKLIDRVTGLGYEPVILRNAEDFKANLKTQLEKHNSITLSNTEFKSILNHLDKGNVFDRAKRLRDKNATVPNLAKLIKISSNSLPKPKCSALPGLPSLPITLPVINTVDALPKTYSRNVCINM